uniref:Uncharacterized protein n=1 Tax=viral metagenome TaxID=1070528 RepID=A0A6C0EBV2_9ZZZZ
MSPVTVSSPVAVASPVYIKGPPDSVQQPIPALALSTSFPLVSLKLNPTLYVDVDTGLNDNYMIQKDVTEYIRYKTLDKWLYDDMKYLLKYLVVDDGKVRVVRSSKEKDDNKISSDSTSDLEKKSDYIGENILTKDKTRDVLIRILRQFNVKWFDLPHKESLVRDMIERYLKHKLKKQLADRD